MESFLDDTFDVKAKHAPDETLQKWRKLCGVVKNPKRRFRFTANISKRSEAAAMRRTNQEKLRIAVLVSKAAFQFISSVSPSDYTVPSEVKAAGFDICADELGSIVEGHDVKKLRFHGGVSGIARKLCTSTNDGLPKDADALRRRQELFGINKFAESESRSFWVFVWEALHDMTLMILAVCAFVSLIVGIATEGWPKGAHDGLGIVASIMLVVFVTATSDYRQSLQFKDLDKEKKKISIQVTRNGFRQKMSIYDLLPGDIVHLAIGDQVPADGLFVSGFSVLIDESSLTGESEPVMVAKESADVIILDDNFSTIVTVAKWGRSVYINIQKFVQFQLTVNVVALVVNFSSACMTGSAPLTAVQLLWVNMIMDTLGALALATEPPNNELMKRAPVGRKGHFITNVMWRNILGQSFYQFLIIWKLQASGKLMFELEGPNSDLVLNTIIFNSFVFCQVFNEISSREMESINVFRGIMNNYVFVMVLGATVAFQIIIIELLGTFANTTHLTSHQWGASVLIGFIGMPIAAILKMVPV
ncbi:unnamed protein product [Linum tenue]|uniref:P-type Ca(2+) transporter n=1 Tax=Linum tenue TaxID=586396 RepID=A0AAV0L804_9ROSI|nr:unnamed protein product [Linum tenue]